MAANSKISAGFVEWEDFPGLVGRKFSAPDGIATVTDERTPGGLYIILRGDGRRQGMRPAFVQAALERAEVQPATMTGFRHHDKCNCGCHRVIGAAGALVEDEDTPKLAGLGLGYYRFMVNEGTTSPKPQVVCYTVEEARKS